MRFLPKFPQRSWEKSAFGAFGREILRPKRSPRISSRVSGRLGGLKGDGGGIGAGGSPAGQGSGGIAEKLSPTLQKPLSFTLQKSLSLITFFNHFLSHCKNRFPLSRDARGKTVNEKPARGLPHDNRPRRVALCVLRNSVANEQKRSQTSMALCAKCAGKPRKAGRNPLEIAG